MRYGFALLLIFCQTIAFGYSLSKDNDVAGALKKPIDLTQVSYLVDDQRVFTAETIVGQDNNFKATSSRHLDVLPRSIVWLKIPIRNEGQIRNRFALVNYFTPLNAEAYLKDSRGLNALEKVAYRYPTFLLDKIEPTSILYVKADVGTYSWLHLSPMLYKDTEWLRDGMRDNLLEGIALGIIGIMVFYNLGLCISLRKRYFAYYAAYTLSVLLILAFSAGYIYFNHGWMVIWVTSAEIFLVLFISDALRMHRYPIVTKLKYAFVFSLLVLAAVISLRLVQIMSTYFVFILICSIGVVGSAIRSLQKYSPAYFLFLGWLMVAVALGLGALSSTLGMPWLAWSPLFGVVLEICFFSYAIGVKARISEQLALRAKEHSYEQLKKVFYPHQISLMEAGQDLEATMPIGSGEAYVLAFDTVASSTLDQDTSHAFLRKLFQSYHELFMEGYEAEACVATAYRVKEMGDGFVCTIGFPFAVPGDADGARTAFSLALKLFDEFDQLARGTSLGGKLYCRIGIAKGPVTSFFPESGTKEFDLYGHGIVLALRYESAAKHIYSTLDEPANIIALSESVHKDLPDDIRKHLLEYDLAGTTYRIRNDEGAVRFYYFPSSPGQQKLTEAS